MSYESRLEKEIEMIENDHSLSPQEKDRQIKELIRELRDYEREMQRRDDYDRELGNRY